MLAVVPDDQAALRALERMGRATGDRSLLRRIQARLAATADDPAQASQHLTAVGESLEGVDDGLAMDAYREALVRDGDNMTASTALVRVAERSGDAMALSEALAVAARATQNRREAADLLVRCGLCRLESGADPAAAAADFQEALEREPEHVAAADNLKKVLLSLGHAERLVDLLSRAAGSVRPSSRAAELWLDVARLYAESLQRRAIAIATLKRALQSVPEHAPTLRTLAELYVADRQWHQAVELYDRILATSSDTGVLCEAHLAVAALCGDKLDDQARARASLAAALALDPAHSGALARLLDSQLGQGDFEAAATTARRLARVAKDKTSLAWALTRLGSLERRRGDVGAAVESLSMAVVHEGPGGGAVAELMPLLAEHGRWRHLADALAVHIRDFDGHPARLGPAYIELSRVQADRMGSIASAIATLERGIQTTGGDASLTLELALRLRQHGHLDRAIAQLEGLLARDVTLHEAWQQLAAALRESGLEHEALLALDPLVMLGKASADERSAVSRRARYSGGARPRAFDREGMRFIAVRDALSNPTAALLDRLTAAIIKLYPNDLAGLGLGKRDRIVPRASHPLRSLADAMAEIFAIKEFDLYQHSLAHPLVSVEAADPPAVIVAGRAVNESHAVQCFLLAHAFASLAGGFAAIEMLSRAQVELVLAAAARFVDPGFAIELVSGAELEQLAERLHKATPRRARRAKDEAARAYRQAAPIDLDQWTADLQETALRAAMLVADDFAASLDLIRRSAADVAHLRGAELLRRSPLVADLVRFWASQPAREARQRAGLAPPLARASPPAARD